MSLFFVQKCASQTCSMVQQILEGIKKDRVDKVKCLIVIYPQFDELVISRLYQKYFEEER